MQEERKNSLPSDNLHMKGAWKNAALTFVGALLVFFLFYLFSPGTKIGNLLICVCVAILIALLVFVLTVHSEILDTVLSRIEKYESLCKLTILSLFGVLITSSINLASVSYLETQTKIAERESPIYMEVDFVADRADNVYTISSDIGEAHNVFFRLYDHYQFQIDSVPYEMDICYLSTPISETPYLNRNNHELAYTVENDILDYQTALDVATKAIHEVAPTAYPIQHNRYIEISFFDYRSDQKSYIYEQRKEGIRLCASTPRTYSQHNVGQDLYPENSYEKTVQQATEYLLTNN